MISGISQNDPTATSSGASSTTAAAGTSQVTKNMFLQLLVAQIKNQDPLNPSDGTQFLTQLAQFQTLEQSMNMGTDLAAIRSKVNALPERQRVAVIMHKYQQMDYRQIAGVLKLSESATKSLLFRAYETLREQLKEFVSGSRG